MHSHESSYLHGDMALLIPALRHAAPRLTRQLFQCSQRGPSALFKRVSSNRPQLTPAASPRSIRSFKSSPRCISQAVTSIYSSGGQRKSYRSSRFFPKTSEKVVAYWLLGSAASVFGIVVFGGLTRLTESGYERFAFLSPDR